MPSGHFLARSYNGMHAVSWQLQLLAWKCYVQLRCWICGPGWRPAVHAVHAKHLFRCIIGKLHELPCKIDLSRREFRLVSLRVRTGYIPRCCIMYAVPAGHISK